jgi:prepilin-type processing-associated H-X9-DG protein
MSLIEIAVVMGILVILVMLTIALTRTVTEKRNTTHCIANLRTISGLVMQYVADHDGLFPPSRLQYTKDPTTGERKTVSFLPDLLNRLYLGYNSVSILHPIWWCPGDVERPENMRKHSYGHNQFLGGSQGNPQTWDGQSNPEYDARYASPLLMDKAPGQVIYLIDFVNMGDSKWSSSISAGVWPMRADSTLKNIRDARVDFSRHANVANALFLDGSVRSMGFNDLAGTAGRYIWPYE